MLQVSPTEIKFIVNSQIQIPYSLRLVHAGAGPVSTRRLAVPLRAGWLQPVTVSIQFVHRTLYNFFVQKGKLLEVRQKAVTAVLLLASGFWRATTRVN